MANDVIFKIRTLHNDIAWEENPATRIITQHVRASLPPHDFVHYDVWNETPFDILWASDNPLPRGQSSGNLGPMHRPYADKIHKLSDGEGDINRPIQASLGTLRFTNQATGTTIELRFISAI